MQLINALAFDASHNSPIDSQYNGRSENRFSDKSSNNLTGSVELSSLLLELNIER